MNRKRVVTFGESLLRLTSPGFERFLQTPNFTAVFGGAEANVAVALSSFGMDATYVTVLPENNPIADAAVAELRRFGVDTSQITRSKGRLGTYYMELGADHRAGRVVYDREHSAMALARPGDIRWDNVFDGAGWFHTTGITPAISASAADLSLEAMRAARQIGLTVSFDLNYRRSLWKWGKRAQEVLTEMIAVTDILLANEEHLRMILGKDGPLGARAVADQALTAHANLKAVAISLRESPDAGRHSWSACLNNRQEFLTSRRYDITHIVDRIGAGDAFAAGLIYGWTNLDTRQAALEFAVAASCLKHSIPGDFCRATIEEVHALLAGGTQGRITR
jgi:2-dehydro-3-deoxygluconokinase